MGTKTTLIDYEHDGHALQAEMAWDDSLDTPRPGVLISPNWAGRSPQDGEIAKRLAGAGYVGFALDMYGKGVLGTSREENAANMQPLIDDRAKLQARVTRALDVLCEQPQVDASKTAIFGYCFGGLCALDLARSGADILGAVSFHGLFSAPDNIPTPSIKAKLLLLHGWDDPMATPSDVLAISQELTDANADWQLHAYGNTMHAFTAPGANDPANGTVYDAVADRRSWRAASNFLDELFLDLT
ncbi:MAG: dienelactone hydrolase family protein [Pseudomonadota bacterium]